ncbi:ribonuclease Z [Clostridium acetobutylicum]|uniref:Metal-dependent hydrolases of the beta-lactamase superfamily, possible sulfatase n=1 Tax=Clostridium acetobutylicum (strain ATCC 824 / DSM 792 / JCM 1419 / IAM 19013 / LMG 5710 / NBRC 13948 / NRRL B-527 / VKM B-1787 / 2291 / W) TaxID=272562 RepID=Q97JF6_CLOAB|nr:MULTISPECIES: MBL fold metallo-hydrolase [Clostridium]AAK79298.1 Metal-dependent hydrolases of the beta-lactamase superfamily, possible sulfatase [Clostridium acetobutylicum ATCC 824]ADZ20381.1 Metal-dependent hydrolase of the beta-lactamase superfamily, possible sulfatase [Clostridium acetobutylicum EA 2018]AEI31770.1 beta-lactamase superfamily sulfatase [Clostridium acetobutylicum DSM 1731]AWV81451.1 MBL fold metallo-hydrolase [Clostridium acetobutylicum]MBC2393088.1 MBL fold metallo-hydr
METVNILGTGSAMVTKCYNTCFTLSNGDEHFLVDTGGGNTILTNLEKLHIGIDKIHNVFISHRHNDHITGIIWIIRAVAQRIINGKYDGDLKIYCCKENIEVINTICKLLLEKKFTKYMGNRIVFSEIYDGCRLKVLDWDIEFFDIKSTKQLQFGFTTVLKSGKKLTFLGDEPYRENLYEYANNSDYIFHEAFCLYSEKDIFKPYEKHHATVKDACENADKLSVKNIILYHTEDKNIEKRKELYIGEGSKFFKGNIIVPDDLETIELK